MNDEPNYTCDQCHREWLGYYPTDGLCETCLAARDEQAELNRAAIDTTPDALFNGVLQMTRRHFEQRRRAS